eukprot:CAMPEP_0113397446 /NCGR_PEP_ID=MMETSP0013_2-20120614/14387_1 /TAXON_ID=2843 ORGANISM="Skeletonema costatum, Strain 1716" /NCGR_SAMPLE_ID=MMETSP0013_2 /ASSEMBLY_ACC=CAM_ASM_000158 /LENGTH=212 /DNA_ID=CAMNT_0000282035 /DNA_START=21 /DNA_END=659 /DNA_ORIENTATION=- /assembly_acc=CAM_ASM_000158
MASAQRISVALVALCFLQSLLSCSSFTATPISPTTVKTGPKNQLIHRSSRLASTTTDGDGSSFLDNVTKTYDIFQKARSDGYDFKQSTAIALAGEYDADAVKAEIEEQIDSAPCVMFTWEASPACKKAIKYLDVAGAKYKIVRLDDPWEDGNPIRAELGKKVGRSSVPCIFIGGEYVGGFDGGVGDESPGILEMAFKGTLREKLMAVGALDA